MAPIFETLYRLIKQPVKQHNEPLLKPPSPLPNFQTRSSTDHPKHQPIPLPRILQMNQPPYLAAVDIFYHDDVTVYHAPRIQVLFFDQPVL